MLHKDQQHNTETYNWLRVKVLLEQTTATGTEMANKPFLIEQKAQNVPLCFCRILFSAYQLLNLWMWHFNTVLS